jgi:hypothetical protein
VGEQRREEGTRHVLGAKCLNSWMGDFNSWRSMQAVGMPRALRTGADSDSDRDGDSEELRESWQQAAGSKQGTEARSRGPRAASRVGTNSQMEGTGEAGREAKLLTGARRIQPFVRSVGG